jgi:hypothetical protein
MVPFLDLTVFFCGGSKTMIVVVDVNCECHKVPFFGLFLIDDIHPSCRPHMQENCSTICASKRRVAALLDGGRYGALWS